MKPEKLADSILGAKAPPAGLPSGSQAVAAIFGVVISIQATSLTIQLGGSTTSIAGVRYLSTYAPAVNDVVLVLQAASDLVIVGSLTAATSILRGVPQTGGPQASGDAVTSTTYAVYPTNAGPAVTLYTGTKVIVVLTATIVNTAGSSFGYMGFAVSGASTIGATDNSAVEADTAVAGGAAYAMSAAYPVTVTAGQNTFTCQGRTNAGTSTHSNRSIIVIPL